MYESNEMTFHYVGHQDNMRNFTLAMIHIRLNRLYGGNSSSKYEINTSL